MVTFLTAISRCKAAKLNNDKFNRVVQYLEAIEGAETVLNISLALAMEYTEVYEIVTAKKNKTFYCEQKDKRVPKYGLKGV